MEHSIDLRDIKPVQQKKEKIEEVDVLPTQVTSAVKKSLPSLPSIAERGQFTREQSDAMRFSYFFQRENGEIFSTSAIDAWNQMEYMKNNRIRNLKFIGVSDGNARRKIMQEKEKLISAVQHKIAALGQVSVKLNNKEAETIILPDSVEKKETLQRIAGELEKVIEEQQRLIEMSENIENEIVKVEIEDARKNGGTIPDFSISGNEKGVHIVKTNNPFNG